MALRDKLTLAGKTRSRVCVFGSFFRIMCSCCCFLVVVFSLFSVFLAVLCLVFGFSWKSLWHKPADKLQKKTMHFLEARQTQRGTHVPITRVATATRPRHLDQTGTHTEGATPKRHTNIQVIFNYPKIYDIQKLITNKYKHKHIYIYIYGYTLPTSKLHMHETETQINITESATCFFPELDMYC